MPFGDGTGPIGQGPMTGRAFGYCAGYAAPGYMTPGPGMGRGRGLGRGRGWQWRARYMPPGAHPYAPPYAPVREYTRQEELESLQSQAEMLQKNLEEVQNRIKELEKEKEDQS